MAEVAAAVSIADWLADVRSRVVRLEPDLVPLFDIYAAEATFGRRYIDADLSVLPQRAEIVEIGAGPMLLSCYLAMEGFRVTAVEPTGGGFSHLEKIRQHVLGRAAELRTLPRVLDMPAEHLALHDCFEYGFSINVMEHVGDVEQVLLRVGQSLAPGATYRFTCPNYLFPYEPHFNIPTLFSKSLTARFLARRIFRSETVPDPVGTWDSLNWINVLRLKRIAARTRWMEISFGRDLLESAFIRAVQDPVFSARRSPGIRKLASLLVHSGLHRVFGWVPAAAQPLMDCRLKRRLEPGRV